MTKKGYQKLLFKEGLLKLGFRNFIKVKKEIFKTIF